LVDLSATEHITLFVGSGTTVAAVPLVEGMLALADDYAEYLPDGAGLVEALDRARADHPRNDIDTYLAYRRAFAAWVAGNEFDVVAQEAVLRAYQSTDPTALSSRGRWQRIEAPLGERLERDVDAWALPDGIAALGSLLAALPDRFNERVLTTNFDPLLEVAIRRCGGTATTVRLGPDGPDRRVDEGDGSIHVFHLHGYWRPDPEYRQRLLHDPDYLTERRPTLARRVAEQVRSSVVCVVGYSGWDGLFASALNSIAAQGRALTVLWAAHSADERTSRLADVLGARLSEAIPQRMRPVVEIFAGVDSDALFPALARGFGVTVPARRSRVRTVRHGHWERELISEPGTHPPDDLVDLLRQLDRRYRWERWLSSSSATPTLVFWPVRLRSTPSVIHMVQALAAAALSARGAAVVACIDDFNVDRSGESMRRFEADVTRWFAEIPESRAPRLESLRDFIERNEIHGYPRETAAMKRPIGPWGVAQEVFGERNPSVLSVLMATKIIPDLPTDRLANSADLILRALESQNARRLLTPLTLWSYLNHLLIDRPTDSVITLGGREESRLWELWRDVFDHGVSQLYNPRIHALNNQSLMLRWSDTDELRSYLDQALARRDWNDNGRYFCWLVQNAFLLPTYLATKPAERFRGIRLDSWAAVQEAVKSDRSIADTIARHVSDLYLGRS
jgi:hypothetical protein